MAVNKVIIEAELGTKSFEKQIDEVEARLEEIDTMLSKPKAYRLNKSDIAKLNVEGEKLNNKLTTLYQKQNQLNQSHIFENMGKSINNVIKKIAKWTLAIVGIRSIYLGIRSAMSTLTQEDKQLGAQVDYMKWALANSIKPVIEWIIKAMYTIIKLIAKIIYAFSGYNIFKNSGIGDYEKSMKESNKSAKKLKKTLAGFDEMNVLNSDTSSGGGILPSPELDISNIENFGNEVTKVAESMTDNWLKMGNEMREVLDNPEFFTQAFGDWGLFIEGLVQTFMGLWDVVTGFVEVVGSVMDIVVGIFTGNFDLIKQGWNMLCEGLWNIFKGTLEIIIGLLQTMLGIAWGLIKETWNVIWGLISGIAGLIYDWVVQPIINSFEFMWNIIINGAKNLYNFMKKTFSNIVNLFKNIGTRVGNAIAGAFKIVINGVLGAIENILNFPINSINKLIDVINAVPGINIGKLNTFNLPRLAKGGIVNNPGPGVMMGNYIAGERGAEGVIPLTDSQQMALLGEAIGKYINIHLTNVTELDGRTIARKVQEISNSNNFLMNR